jgi:hypothetical protein
MKCPRCGRDAERGWEYCPRCGYSLGRDSGFFRFDDAFERVHRQMEKMSRMFEKDFEVFDLSPVFKEIPAERRAKGFRITMRSGTGMEPRISVQTFGDKNEELKREVMEQLGIEKGTEKQEPVKREARPAATEKRRFRIPVLSKPSREKVEICTPELTEEPKTCVRRLDSGVVVDIEIPGVESLQNVDVRELESSVEVKALAGKKAYFKILTKPPQFRLSGKSFERGKLHLEFS